MMKKILSVGLLVLLLSACKKDKIVNNTLTGNGGTGLSSLANVYTDKAIYMPGSNVVFTLDKPLPAGTKVRYKLLGNVVHDAVITGLNWTWNAPQADFKGYLAELYGTENNAEKIYGTIAIDVSSDPAKFPRNGFLSSYGQMSPQNMGSIMKSLNRYHMNWIQFQDWGFKHQMPLAGTVSKPDANWKDIANRDNYMSTVKGYISLAQQYNMKTLSYNLAFGALNDAATDGVPDQWYLFTDQNHTTKDKHPLPQPFFKSDIYLTNPGNTEWQNYIAGKTNDAYAVYPFDGFQIDQLGNRGKNLYDYSGNSINLEQTYPVFIAAMQKNSPGKRLVMNAVNQYGQIGIAGSPVDFLYTEVWEGNETYTKLAGLIRANDDLTNNRKKTVLAAYMNYQMADNKGYFNTPGVILTDAVIFAFGGAHLELGEHMLGKEYFPNNNLEMRSDLQQAMVCYYDFAVAYQNLLRDGGTFNTPAISAGDNQMVLNNWPPQTGQVSVIGKDLGQQQVIHLLNFNNAQSLEWRDNAGKQTAPVRLNNVRLNFKSVKTVKKVWFASPDFNGGASQELKFTSIGTNITFNVPVLHYWDMIVIEY